MPIATTYMSYNTWYAEAASSSHWRNEVGKSLSSQERRRFYKRKKELSTLSYIDMVLQGYIWPISFDENKHVGKYISWRI